MRRPITMLVFLVLAALLGANLAAGAATANDKACRKATISGSVSHGEIVAYDACRFDKLDAAVAALKPSTTVPTSTVSPTPSAGPTNTTVPSPTATSSPAPSPTTTVTTGTTSWPATPPARICGSNVLNGPVAAPAGATVVPAGDNSSLHFPMREANKSWWFAPGVHTLGADEFAQIIPGDGSSFIGAPGAVIDGRGVNRVAFGQTAKNVTIKYLTIRGFASQTDQGVVNHDSGTGWKISYNTITANKGAVVFAGTDGVVDHNCLSNNGQYGFQVVSLDGPKNVVLDHNEISGNDADDLESINGGCGCTGGGKFWDAHGVKVTANYVHDNKSVGLWADTNDSDFLIDGNWIENNDAQGIFYEISYNATIRNNVLRHNLLKTGPTRIKSGDPFPDAAIYLSESGGDPRVPSTVSGSNGTIDITGNLFADNYNGVSLWENADRFCGSPNNTSTGYCTLVNPSQANLGACSDHTKIKSQPYLSDCRWKTQNVKVHGNTFTMNRGNFFACSVTMCGRNAVFANAGSSPSWSPYQGFGVQKAITTSQGNVFSRNTYIGGWGFTAPDPGGFLATAKQWQSAPYSQDSGSTFG